MRRDLIEERKPSDAAITISEQSAVIQNAKISIRFNLTTGEYSGIARSDDTCMFRDAWFRVGEGGWKEPELTCEAERRGRVTDVFGNGETLRVWYRPRSTYDPDRFLDITVYEHQPFFAIGWGVRNTRNYTVRVRLAEVLVQGELFAGQEPVDPKVLRGGAGGDENFVEETWKLNAVNSGMLTYHDRLCRNQRRTLVAGGLHYSEYLRTVDFHEKRRWGHRSHGAPERDAPGSFITLTVRDPQGKRIAPGEMWKSSDTFFVDFCTADPFESLEGFGAAMARANNANPHPYDFITLCGWMTSMKKLGDGLPVNNSPGLVEEMTLAKETGLTRYTAVAVRLEPDYYCYESGGDTQQGWWDDEHWACYGSLLPPYETFKKFAGKIGELGGKVFTYVQTSMPSNDFALAHPGWILNNDISLLYEHRQHAHTLVRFDYTDPGLQEYLLAMWTRLGNDGVVGLKFDYPESGWASDGGFEDVSYTTVSAYRKIYQLCRAGLGPKAYLHERIIGFDGRGTPCTDVNVGIVDLQRVWEDASHFEPEMASRIGLRWYKQGVAFRYYPDGKSFFPGGTPLATLHRRTFLTLVGLLSGRIEIGTSFRKLTEEIRHDLTRLYPMLPNGKAFRPVDFLLAKKHPEVYVYRVDDQWVQVILVNNVMSGRQARTVAAPISGTQADLGSLGLRADRRYHVFDFWAQKNLGIIEGSGALTARLEQGEARVYAVREVLDRPQILGTNRHVMCGMMEISEPCWDAGAKTLGFRAAVVGRETMEILIALPEGGTFKPVAVTSADLEVSFTQNGNYVKLFASTQNNHRGWIAVEFEQ